MSIKYCKKCGEPKEIAEFNVDASRWDGRHPYCKACKAIQSHERYTRIKDRISAQDKVRYQANRETVLTKRKADYERTREDRAAQPKPPRQLLSTDQKRARKRAWVVTHQTQERERKQARRAANPDHFRAVHARWRGNNRIRILAKHHAREARLIGRSGAWTVAEWAALIACFGNRCLCCGATERITVDHVIPMKLGGTNEIANLQPLCFDCNNHKKQNTTDYRDPVLLAQFLAQIGTVRARPTPTPPASPPRCCWRRGWPRPRAGLTPSGRGSYGIGSARRGAARSGRRKYRNYLS